MRADTFAPGGSQVTSDVRSTPRNSNLSSVQYRALETASTVAMAAHHALVSARKMLPPNTERLAAGLRLDESESDIQAAIERIEKVLRGER